MMKTLSQHKKHLSQLTCVITLPYSVVTESSFVMTEFICYIHSFMLRLNKDCHDKVPLSFSLFNVATESRVSSLLHTLL